MKRLTLITLILGTALAIVPAASAMVLSDGSDSTKAVVPSTQPANEATRALVLRSEGLAAYYAMSPATQAVVLRSKAIADYYGLNGVTFRPDILGGNGGSSITPVATGGDSFAWGTAIAASLLGVLLVAAASFAVTRRRYRLSF